MAGGERGPGERDGRRRARAEPADRHRRAQAGGQELRATIIELDGKTPQVADDAFIAPTAVLIGDVTVRRGREHLVRRRPARRQQRDRHRRGLQRPGQLRHPLRRRPADDRRRERHRRPHGDARGLPDRRRLADRDGRDRPPAREGRHQRAGRGGRRRRRGNGDPGRRARRRRPGHGSRRSSRATRSAGSRPPPASTRPSACGTCGEDARRRHRVTGRGHGALRRALDGRALPDRGTRGRRRRRPHRRGDAVRRRLGHRRAVRLARPVRGRGLGVVGARSLVAGLVRRRCAARAAAAGDRSLGARADRQVAAVGLDRQHRDVRAADGRAAPCRRRVRRPRRRPALRGVPGRRAHPLGPAGDRRGLQEVGRRPRGCRGGPRPGRRLARPRFSAADDPRRHRPRA